MEASRIIIQDLNKTFGKQKALDHINLELTAGQSVSLIGPNGSGKTTLIKCLLGMVIPDSGRVTVNGKNIYKNHSYRKNIGYMPQIGRYPDYMRVGQLIQMMKDIRKSKKGIDQQKLDLYLVEAFELNGIAQKTMRTLSGGMRQKVSACLAFLFDPSVLILDEPTAGLDPLSSEILKEKILQEKEKGKLILITSHILSDLEEVCSEVIYLMEGKVCFFQSMHQLKKETGEEKLSKAIAKIMLNGKVEKPDTVKEWEKSSNMSF